MRTQTQSMLFGFSASVAASLCLVAAAGPAFARGPADPLTSAPRTAPSTTDGASKKICMETEAFTGSRIRGKVCKTRAEWEAEGYTVGTRAKSKAKRG